MSGLISRFQAGDKNSMVAEVLKNYVLASLEVAMKIQGNRRQWDSWHQKDNFVKPEILLPGWIRNILHLPDQISQIIPDGVPQLFA